MSFLGGWGVGAGGHCLHRLTFKLCFYIESRLIQLSSRQFFLKVVNNRKRLELFFFVLKFLSFQSLSHQKNDGCGHARPSFFWYDNDSGPFCIMEPIQSPGCDSFSSGSRNGIEGCSFNEIRAGQDQTMLSLPDGGPRRNGFLTQIGGKLALDLHFTLLLIPFSMLILPFPLRCRSRAHLWKCD